MLCRDITSNTYLVVAVRTGRSIKVRIIDDNVLIVLLFGDSYGRMRQQVKSLVQSLWFVLSREYVSFGCAATELSNDLMAGWSK